MIGLPSNHFCLQHKNEALKKGSLTESTAGDTKIRLLCLKLFFLYKDCILYSDFISSILIMKYYDNGKIKISSHFFHFTSIIIYDT